MVFPFMIEFTQLSSGLAPAPPLDLARSSVARTRRLGALEALGASGDARPQDAPAPEAVPKGPLAPAGGRARFGPQPDRQAGKETCGV